MTGTTISHYKVISELGRGGMGVVYRAEDTKLNRTVALKVLSPHMLGSRDDTARFYREARASAALHHPNIATVFEIDEFDGAPFIAMEFVDGTSLDEYIARGPLPLTEVVDLAAQIADALIAAHNKNIVHRDVKSANIRVTPAGKAKVLDFGLAKTAASTKLTQMGSTVGTVAYMSPEQARGQEVDQRSDIWSLGAVIYEMTTGKLPFPGSYEQAVVYNILNTDPEPLTALRTGVPVELERIVAKCLSKDSDRRYQTALEIPIDLRSVDLNKAASSSGLSSVLSIPAVGHERRQISPRPAAYWGLGSLAVGALLVAAAFVFFAGRDPVVDSQRPVRKLSIVLPSGVPFAAVGNAPLGVGHTALALSDDGRHLAYLTMHNGVSRVAVRSMDSHDARILDGTDGAYLPIFSPDGDWIAFVVGNILKKVGRTGGAPMVVAELPTPALNGVWFDEQIVITADQATNVFVVDARSGLVQTFDHKVGSKTHVDVLPGNSSLLLSTPDAMAVISLPDFRVERLLAQSGAGARYVEGGHVVFGARGRLLIAPFDADRLEFTGQALPFVDDVRTEVVIISPQFAVDARGTLIYAPGKAMDLAELVVVDQGGVEKELGLAADFYGAMQLSPDGKKLAVVISEPRESIFIYDLERLSRTRIVSDKRIHSPAWAPDGLSIFYGVDSSGPDAKNTIHAYTLDEARERVVYESDMVVSPSSVSPDGRVVAFSEGTQLAFVEVASGQKVDSMGVAGQDALLWGAQFSPDGRFIAYSSDESGRSEVWVRMFRDGRKWQVSTGGGEEPIWSESGMELFFSNGRKWYSTAVKLTPTFSPGRPRVMFEGPYLNVPGIGYDVFPGDDTFILVRELEQGTLVRELRVIENAFSN